MTNTEPLSTILNRWTQINAGWNDETSARIEHQYLAPLSNCTAMISDTLSEADAFIALIESRLEQIETYQEAN